MSVSVTVSRERLCSVNINMFPLLPILPPPTIHLIVLYFQARRGAGLSFCNSGCFLFDPLTVPRYCIIWKECYFFFNKSFFHTGYTLNTVKLSISRSQVTTFQEPSFLGVSQPRGHKDVFYSKIHLRFFTFILFLNRLPFSVFFLPDLIGKLEPEMWTGEPHR